jgi:hypothetical protein
MQPGPAEWSYRMVPTRAFRRGLLLAAAVVMATSIGAAPLYAVDDSPKTEQKKVTTKKTKAKKPQEASGPVNPGYPNEPAHGSGY